MLLYDNRMKSQLTYLLYSYDYQLMSSSSPVNDTNDDSVKTQSHHYKIIKVMKLLQLLR